PIPFYAEMGSLNPLVVTPAAAASRAAEIAEGYVGSFTLGAGQFCTKPGLLFAPADTSLRIELASRVAELGGSVLLNAGIADAFSAGAPRLTDHPGVEIVGAGSGPLAPVLFPVRAPALTGPLLEECFGPAAILVTYENEAELLAALAGLEGNLTATIHAEEG